MEKLHSFWGYISRYKYLVILIVGTVTVGFLGENSIYHSIIMQYEIMDLKKDIKYYSDAYESDKKHLRELELDKKNIERVARERYYMKADDEDIFVFSTDKDLDNKQVSDNE